MFREASAGQTPHTELVLVSFLLIIMDVEKTVRDGQQSADTLKQLDDRPITVVSEAICDKHDHAVASASHIKR